MPKRKPQQQRSESNGNGFHISYGTLGALAALLTIMGIIVGIGEKVATKSDIESIKSTITPTLQDHENRLRSVELAMAARFGASPTSAHTADERPLSPQTVNYLLAAFPQSLSKVPAPPSASPRRVVVPLEMIEVYHMQSSQGGSYGVLGEDGKLYSIDDVLALLIQLHMTEPAFQQMIKRQAK